MKKSPTVAFDTEREKENLAAAAHYAAMNNPQATFIAFGRQKALEDALTGFSPLPNLQLAYTEDVVPMDADGRTGASMRKSSMHKAIRAVAEGDADCVVSSGNTAAYVIGCSYHFKLIPHVGNPAITTIWPVSSKAPEGLKCFVMLDSGAIMTPTAEDMLSWALVGRLICSTLNGAASVPIKPYLLNVGTERDKGTPFSRSVYALLEERLGDDFGGNVEPRGILDGRAPVVLAHGELGNVCLKMAEDAVCTVYSEIIRAAKRLGPEGKRGAEQAADQVMGIFGYGAARPGILGGLRKPSFKLHGETDLSDVCIGLSQVPDMVECGLTTALEEASFDPYFP